MNWVMTSEAVVRHLILWFGFGWDITSFYLQTGIEPTSVICLGKMWRKQFPARGCGICIA